MSFARSYAGGLRLPVAPRRSPPYSASKTLSALVKPFGREQGAECSGARRLTREQAFTHAAVMREHQARGLLPGMTERMYGAVALEFERAHAARHRREGPEQARIRGIRCLRAAPGPTHWVTRAAVSMPTTMALISSAPDEPAAVLARSPAPR